MAASLFTLGAGLGAGVLGELGLKEALLGAAALSTGLALALRKLGGPTRRWGSSAVRLGFTPWGVVVGEEDAPRVLHWPALRGVQLHMVYGRDMATPSTLWSVVSVETEHERFAGRTAGAAPLERLLVHLDAYTSEASRRVALDMDGERCGEGPTEPDFELLLSAAADALHEGPASTRLGVPTSGYRFGGGRAASPQTIDALRAVLRDRVEHELDRRPLAAVLVAELGLTTLVPELTRLVQSPHPMVAAVAKAAAIRLGAPTARVGLVEEVAPFLLAEDAAAIDAWACAPSLYVRASA